MRERHGECPLPIMNIEPSPPTVEPHRLKSASLAMRAGDYLAAVSLYAEQARGVPALAHATTINVSIARKRGLDSLLAAHGQKTVRRAAVFASFSQGCKIEDYVVHYLQCLAQSVDYIVFVADNELCDAELAKLSSVVDHAIVSRHGEYDFGSYKRGLQHLWESAALPSFDEVVLCNDSCYGPVQSFAWIFHEMCSRKSDFWGLTQNSEFGAHIQSYFVVFSRRVFLSEVFRQFFLSVKAESNVQKVIISYEVGLTRVLAGAGFDWDSFINPSHPGVGRALARNTNPTVFPIFLLQQGAQLVKVKATRHADRNFDGVADLLGVIACQNRELLAAIGQHDRAAFFPGTTQPRFSMILPVYNRRSSVLLAIDSALTQAYGDFELIVVDDGSTDGTTEIVCRTYPEQIKHGKLRVIRYAVNEGVSNARNVGIAAARGDWICYLDSDNTLADRFFGVFAQEIGEHPNTPCFYAQMKRCSSAIVDRHEFDYSDLLRENYIDLGVFVHHRAVVDAVGAFDFQLRRLVDWDFILRATKDHRVQFVPEVVLSYQDDAGAVDRISIKESYDLALGQIRQKHRIPYAISCVVNGVIDDQLLANGLDAACSVQFCSDIEYQVVYFDNSLSETRWALVENCAARYPNVLCANRQRTKKTEHDNLCDAIGAAQGDFVLLVNAADVNTTIQHCGDLASYLIDNPGIPGARLLDNTPQACRGLDFPSTDSDVVNLRPAMYRRQVFVALSE
jgi:hypothetical protein